VFEKSIGSNEIQKHFRQRGTPLLFFNDPIAIAFLLTPIMRLEKTCRPTLFSVAITDKCHELAFAFHLSSEKKIFVGNDPHRSINVIELTSLQ
jgi:hypothetical protein